MAKRARIAGIELAREALIATERHFAGAPETPDATIALAECYRRLAGLQQWRWQITRGSGDLKTAIATFDKAIQCNDRARRQGRLRHPGFLAQLRLKQIVLLRIDDNDIERLTLKVIEMRFCR